MTLSDLRSWLTLLAEAEALIPARKVLEALPEGDGQVSVERDLTLKQVAERVGRAVSTVRTWCNGGRLVGAYRLNGREWRVPRAALEAYLDRQRSGAGDTTTPLDSARVGWDDWREDGR